VGKISNISFSLALAILLVGPLPVAAQAQGAPQGEMNMSVQDLTSGGPVTQSYSNVFAPQVNPGDELQFQVILANQGNADMVGTEVTDNLPAGLNLVSEDNLNVGTLAFGSQIYLNITATVTGNPGEITNQACFVGNSADGSSPQSGCAIAVIVVQGSSASSNATSTSSSPPATGGQGGGSGTPLPATGSTQPFITGAIGLSAIGLASLLYVRARRKKTFA
jgi:uncharacterized repeat protein (TIGR01451 family)/LPXTG-motif cell wall-anchored protein